ncbi:MAG: HU family DNA-binding protein [Muribaculaceae bacterium]|nr:HU family DNA-binding protein [Muribaculaceae bacterium]MBQ5549218.1 HU family DNA-binding protein [Prevotella sp.]
MGKIKQGILGGFKGKVGTVIGSSWNGIAYMRGLPQSTKDRKSAAQLAQRDFFREVQDLVGQLSYEQLVFLFPNSAKGMSRRNLLVKQLSADPLVAEGSKHADLADITSLGNAPTADLPDVSIVASRSAVTISWDADNDWRSQHADEYPTICVFNVTQKKIFLVHSTVTVGASGSQSFSLESDAFGIGSSEFNGFMLSTGSKIPLVGFGTMGVVNRPARQRRNPRTGK